MTRNVLLEQENYQYIQLKLLCMDYTSQLISEMIIQSFHQQYYYNININTSNALNITDVHHEGGEPCAPSDHRDDRRCHRVIEGWRDQGRMVIHI